MEQLLLGVVTNQFQKVGWSGTNQPSWLVSDASDEAELGTQTPRPSSSRHQFDGKVASEAVLRQSTVPCLLKHRRSQQAESDTLAAVSCRPTNFGWYLQTNQLPPSWLVK